MSCALSGLRLVFASMFFALGLSAQQSPAPVILPEDDAETPETQQLVFETEPGVRYDAASSNDLINWTSVDGFPAEAESVVAAIPFAVSESEAATQFFQVNLIDEQPPEIVDRFPDDDDFAILRFSVMTILLEDFTGVDPASISLTLGNLGPYTVSSPELTYADGLLTLDLGGDQALGDYGATIEVDLAVADAVGNGTTHDWSFDLELEPVVAENLFVFGSPNAQRAGQRIGAIPTRILAERYASGPIRMADSATPWTISSVNETSVTISYSGESAPEFAVGTYLANMTPKTINEIFYRQVVGVEDDAENKMLTLQTEEVSLLDIVEEGTTSTVGAPWQNVAFTADAQGVIQRAIFFDENLEMEPVVFDYDGMSLGLKKDGFEYSKGDFSYSEGTKPTQFSIMAEELNVSFSPSVRAMLEITLLDGLKRYETVFNGDLYAAMVFDFEVTGTLPPLEKTFFDIPFANIVVPLPPILGVPVALVITPGARLKAGVEVKAIAGLRSGIRQEASGEVGISFDRNRSERFKFINEFVFAPTDLVEPRIDLVGQLRGGITLEPYLYALLYGTAGASITLPTKGELVIELDVLAPELEPEVRWEASVGLELAPALHPTVERVLDWDPSFKLSVGLWKDQWHIFPERDDLAFILEPESVSAPEGTNVRLNSAVNRSSGVSFQWSKGETPLPRKTQSYLNLLNVNRFHSGDYTVTVTPVDGESITSAPAALTVLPGGATGTAPAGFVRIAPGTFTMGSPTSEPGRNSSETQHTVTLTRGFYLQQTEVTKAQWDAVAAEGPVRGYTDLPAGRDGYNGDGSGEHPVTEVSWYDVVKWLNLKSELEGLTPCYTVSGSTYKTGQSTPACDFDADGYRLPTEAEWEYACRAGTTTAFYSGPITYTGSSPLDPNLDAIGWYGGNSGGNTHPVGQKQANAWGLYDMSGNVWEWCWDWLGTYPGTVTDPTGSSSGSYRAFRGGDISNDAQVCRSAHRGGFNPVLRYGIGFRPARSE